MFSQDSDNPEPQNQYRGACADFVNKPNARSSLFHMSASCIFGQRRTYQCYDQLAWPKVNPYEDNGDTLEEFFISNKFGEGGEVWLFVEQSESELRCVAGINADMSIPLAMESEKILGHNMPLELSIYELDPPEGVSPVTYETHPEENKYAYKLFQGDVRSEENITFRFIRPSSARYLVLVFSSSKQLKGNGYLCIREMKLIQSAHVSVVPRISRSQTIKKLYFRLVGEDLADDYARLGKEGFSFIVEHLVANQPVGELFRANGLADLLQTGQARLFSNHRRRQFEYENVTTEKGSFAIQKSSGWNRSETGVEIPQNDGRWERWGDLEKNGLESHGFRSFGNQESRTHTTHVGSTGLADNEENVVEASIHNFFVETAKELFEWDISSRELWRNEITRTIWRPWEGIDRSELKVNGIWNINLPPYFKTVWDKWFENVLPRWNDYRNDPKPETLKDVYLAYSNLCSSHFLLSNALCDGLSIGANFSAGFVVGGGASVSFSKSFPNILISNAIGTSGIITLNGYESGYSYNQHETTGHLRSDHESKIHRMTERIPILDGHSNVDKRNQRVRGAEVAWQCQPMDIVTGSIPLGITLPAIAGKMYSTTDHSLRVRLPNGIGNLTSIDIWFDISEVVIKDDY